MIQETIISLVAYYRGCAIKMTTKSQSSNENDDTTDGLNTWNVKINNWSTIVNVLPVSLVLCCQKIELYLLFL